MKKLTKMAIATLVAATALSAAPELTWNGDAQFRFREQWLIQYDSAGVKYEDSTKTNYTNKYAWNLKLSAEVNEQFSMKFRISNPNGSALQTVGNDNSELYNRNTVSDVVMDEKDSSHQYVAIKNSNLIAIPRAEMIWKPGVFSLSAGILEVKSNTPLTLAAAGELHKYQKAIHSSLTWGVLFNNSQVGAKIGFDLKALDINLVYAVASQKEATDSTDKIVNETGFRFILDAPIALAEGKIKITPTIVVRTAASGTLEDKTIGANGGLDFTGKFNKMFSLSAGAAYGQFLDADATDDEWRKPSGMLAVVKPVISFGINKVSVAYSLGTSTDLTSNEALMTSHTDFIWAIGVNKNFTIMPRFRSWFFRDSDESNDYKNLMRPELIFVGKF